jgi:ABC-2 type transport system permease protein
VAEVTNSAAGTSLSQQLWLVAGLRWKIFRNGLRAQTEKMHLVGAILLGLIFVVMVLGLATGICFGSYEIASAPRTPASTGQWIFLTAILWGIFMFWQFVPVLASQTNPGFDGRNLLRFPLRFSAFLLMSIAYGLADPFALAGILFHVAMGVGVSIARPDIALWAALALATSVLMNLLFNRMLFAWLERILAKRRTREVLGALFILCMISLNFTSVALQRWQKPLKKVVTESAVVWKNLPPSEAGAALSQALAGDSPAALEAVGVLALYTAAFAGLFAIRAHAQYTGEDLGESAAPVAAPRKRLTVRAAVPEAAASAGEVCGLVSGPVAAIFWKEARYLVRNSMQFMNVFLPLLFIIFFNFTLSRPSHSGRPSLGGKFSSDLVYPAAVAYVCLVIFQSMCPNNLAYEGRGVERYFLSPIKFRSVMLGKNLFHSSLLVMDTLLVLALVMVLGHPPKLLVLLATWAALPFAALVQFSVGNFLSLQYPRRFEFGARRQRPSGLTMMISLSLFATVMGVLAGVAAICLWLAGLWLLPIVYLGLGAAAFFAYRATLDDASIRAVEQREAIIEQLAK